MIDIYISDHALDAQHCTNIIAHPEAGGMCIFIGTVRNSTQGRKVLRLEFEAFEPMARNEMQKIAEYVLKRWPIKNVAIHHRIGTIEIGEIPVIIAVSSEHRDVAFEACQYCIDTLKQTVPIWKKEIFEDGEVWVSAHP